MEQNSIETVERSPKDRAQAAIDALGLSIESTFVPWSQSRNKGEKLRTLNYTVALFRQQGAADKRHVMTTDYSMGQAHCPAYRSSGFKYSDGSIDQHSKQKAVNAECETGRACPSGWPTNKKIAGPLAVDVLYSLVMDADVLNYSSFEEWANNFGYETDSRKAESIYRACLDIALKLRAAIGDDGLRDLQNAFQDY